MAEPVELPWADPSVSLRLIEAETSQVAEGDPGEVVRTCANCGAEMDERKCKFVCRCGYFLSCSDYY